MVKGATLDDLSPEAIAAARNNFKKKNVELAAEMDDWSGEVFLNKAKLTIQGKITRAVLVLLGKPESDHFLTPAVVTLSWILKDHDGLEEDYEHFSAPLLLAVNRLFARIRNLKYRYMADSTLFPEEVNKYDAWVIREALHNCIAHQDYQLGARVVVVEFPDRLVFSNKGGFIPGNLERVISLDAPEPYYRNRFLAQAMVSLNMIDAVGSGIKKMFVVQRRRFFPMPDYCIEPDGVMVTIYGRIVDERFSKLLAADSELLLHDVILLDKVQKGYPLSDYEIKTLRDKNLIEGRKPNLFVSAKVASATGQKAAYTKQKALDQQYYLDMILKLIEQHGEVERADIDELLWKMLPDFLDDKQRKSKINNLLSELSMRQGKIHNIGTRSQPKWVLTRG
ncbi:MAG: transcriptional regulator [Gammaproteobacteria bacterium]|nr:transcriptional regulator [Gammaproteobacteria bacterium]